MEIAVVVLLACFPATTPENVWMTLSKCANSLGLQLQSVVSRKNFPQEWLGI
jgi:hypothetical protein